MKLTRPTSSPPPRQPYALAPGFSLLEVMVGLGLVTLLSAGVYTVAKPARLASQVSGEVARLADLRRSIPGAYAAVADFQGLSNTDPAAAAGADPTPWGALDIHPVDFNAPADGWAATYAQVPSDACAQLASREFNQWAEVRVDDLAMSDTNRVIQSCAGDVTHTVEFRAYPGRRAGALASALPPLGATPKAPPPPAVPIPAPIPGAPPAVTPPPGPGYTSKPVTPVPPPPTGVTVLPPSYTTVTTPPPPKPVYPPACAAPPASSSPENQPASCPSGQVTSSGAGSFVQSRTKTTTYDCPDKYGPVASSVSYSPWSPSASSVCAPPPPPPPSASIPASPRIAYASQSGIDISESAGATSYEMGLSCAPNDVSKPLGYTQQTVPSSVLRPSPNTLDSFSPASQIGGFYTSDPGEPEVVAMYQSLPQSACQAPGYMFASTIQVFVRACNASGCSAWSAPVDSFCSWNKC